MSEAALNAPSELQNIDQRYPHFRIALFWACAFLLAAFFNDQISYGLGLTFLLVSAAAILAVPIFTVFGIIFAFKDEASWSRKLSRAAAMPLAIACMVVLWEPVSGLGRRLTAHAHILQHQSQYDRLPGARAIIPYRNGIMGGDQVIVRDPSRRVEKTPAPPELTRASGGSLISCEMIANPYYLCVFD